MLSLRQFDASVVSATESGADSQAPDHMASTVLQFGAQPSATLPAFIASFAHPVHLDWSPSESKPNVDDGPEAREVDGMATTLDILSHPDSTLRLESQPAKMEHSA